MVTDDSSRVRVPGSLGLGAGFTAVMVPRASAPAGITTAPSAERTSFTTVAVNPSPGLLVLELRVSDTARARSEPAGAATRSTAGAAAGAGGGALLRSSDGAGRSVLPPRRAECVAGAGAGSWLMTGGVAVGGGGPLGWPLPP